MRDKSAKDLAFDRERLKYKKQLEELQGVIREKDAEIAYIEGRAHAAEAKCDELHDWIERLLNYTELSETEMKALIKREKDSAEIFGRLTGLCGILNGRY